jgi:peptidoglycan/xylan/chitin deacetylase (PgdA/CDA1 family)
VLTTLIASSAVIAGAASAVGYATYGVRAQWLGPSDWRGRQDTASVALTFDDGPTEDTERILDVLAERQTPGTFFMIGRQVERHPAIARRVVAEGHLVGNHSYSHPVFLYVGPGETRAQLRRTQQVIADVTGVHPVLSRPPCGVRTPAYFAAARGLGLRTVQWTVAGFDWQRRDPTDIASLVLGGTTAGAIVLLHDGDSANRRDRRATVEALPAIIDGIAKRGLVVGSLQHLLEPDRRMAHA